MDTDLCMYHSRRRNIYSNFCKNRCFLESTSTHSHKWNCHSHGEPHGTKMFLKAKAAWIASRFLNINGWLWKFGWLSISCLIFLLKKSDNNFYIQCRKTLLKAYQEDSLATLTQLHLYSFCSDEKIRRHVSLGSTHFYLHIYSLTSYSC